MREYGWIKEEVMGCAERMARPEPIAPLKRGESRISLIVSMGKRKNSEILEGKQNKTKYAIRLARGSMESQYIHEKQSNSTIIKLK